MKKRSVRGNILTENIIFIILNLVFLSMLMLFLFSKMGGAAEMEERYAKQIALAIDEAKPGMQISIDMNDAIEKTKEELGESAVDSIVTIKDNVVNVKIHKGSGYFYSFFNDVVVSKPYPDEDKGQYVFFITSYKEIQNENSEVNDEQ